MGYSSNIIETEENDSDDDTGMLCMEIRSVLVRVLPLRDLPPDQTVPRRNSRTRCTLIEGREISSRPFFQDETRSFVSSHLLPVPSRRLYAHGWSVGRSGSLTPTNLASFLFRLSLTVILYRLSFFFCWLVVPLFRLFPFSTR